MTPLHTATLRSLVAIGTLLGLVMTGCLGRSVTALADLPYAPTALLRITGAPPASIIAVGGTQQLGATGTTVSGAPVTTFDSLWYQFRTLADSTRLRVSSTGLATGLTAGGAGVLVNVIAFKETSIRADVVVVQVTPTALSGLTFSIQPVAPDSVKLAAGTVKTIVPVVRNPTTGASVSGPAVRYTIKGSDSTRVDVYRGPVSLTLPNSSTAMVLSNANPLYTSLAANQVVALKGEGSAWIYATISAYGTILQDSVQYTLSYPYTRTLSTVKVNLAVQNVYAGQMLPLAPGATVTFQNGVASTDPLTMTYTFDNPAAATAATPASTIGGATGNVTTLIGGQSSNRRFLTPGTYRWTATAAGGPAPWPGQTQSGTLVIK